MKQKHQIHNYEKQLQATLKLIENSKTISETNKTRILGFKGQCLAEGISTGRTNRYMQNLKKMGEWISFEFDKANKKNIVELVGKIEGNSSYSAWTKQFYKVTIKKFYRWIKNVGREDEPEEVRWIKTTIKKSDRTIPKNYPNETDVKKLADAATHPRDKAFILGLYESGCRVSEWANLLIKDVEFGAKGVKITVSGKTGERKIMLVLSLPYLKNWLEVHPRASDPDAPIWVNISTRAKGEAMNYAGIRCMLLELGAQAGLLEKTPHKTNGGKYHTYKGKVDLNPHSFRHARASVLANFLTEAQMNHYFGWEQGSKMPSVYVHLSGRDVDNAILGYYGIKQDKTDLTSIMRKIKEHEEKVKNATSGELKKEWEATLEELKQELKEKRKEKKTDLRIKVCPKCDKENEAYDSYCSRCALPLDLKKAVDIQEVEKGTSEWSAEMMAGGTVPREEFLKLKEMVEQLAGGQIKSN